MNTLKAVLRHLNKEDNVELSSEKVELGLIDDILSDVGANGTGRDKARQLIRSAFGDLGTALEIIERIPKRNDKISKASDKLKSQIKELGIQESSLPQEMRFAIGGQYIDKSADSDIKALRGALSSLRGSSEI